MQKVQSKKINKKVVLLTAMSVLLTAILVLSGVGIYFKLTRKEKPTVEVNPLDFSYDTWDGTIEAVNFNENYAGRGNRTKTINSAASFVHFINEVNAGNTYENYTVYLNSNINLNGRTISSIGADGKTFKGTFDGGHYTILNAKINGNSLFEKAQDATIKNVGLYNCKMIGNSSAGAQNESCALINKAINLNIENCFVRLGNAKLVNEFISTAGPHYIKNSFVDSEAKGLVGSIDTNKTSESGVEVLNCYFTNGEKAVVNPDEEAYVTETKVMKATNKSDFADWSYSPEYKTDKDWCNYDYLANSQKLDFVYPLQAGFVKVYLTGSCYESVMVAGSTIVDATNLAEAFVEADKVEEAEVNLLVEKIFMEARAEAESANITINTIKDTTIVRGENNNDAMFVGSGSSKIVLGGQGDSSATLRSAQNDRSGVMLSAVETSPKLTLDGNREYVEKNNLDSGALVVSYGGEVEIHDNVVIKNNVNNTIGYGGAVMLYHAEKNPIIKATFENCSSLNGGGALAIISGERTNKLSLGSFKNCSSEGNGGALYLAGSLPKATVQAMNTLYGKNNIIQPITTVSSQWNITGNTDLDSSYNETTYSGCTGTNGGAINCTGNLTISGSPTFKNNGYTGYDMDEDGEYDEFEYSTQYGGAIYVDGDVNITGAPTFSGNGHSHIYAGVIYATGDIGITGSAKFIGNSSLEQAAIRGNNVTVNGEAEFKNNRGAYCGATIYAIETATIQGNPQFISNESYDGGIGAGAAAVQASTAIISGGLFQSNSDTDTASGVIAASTIEISGLARFISNTTYYGGVVRGSDVTITGSPEFNANKANSRAYFMQGAAIHATTLTITGSPTFYNNDASSSEATGGGAIYATTVNISDNPDTAEIEYPTFIENITSGNGGAIYATTVNISAPAVFNNNIASSGGAVYSTGNVTISGAAKFNSNRSQAICVASGNCEISGKSEFISNQNAVYVINGTCTVSGNALFDSNTDGLMGGNAINCHAGLVTISGNSIFRNGQNAEYGGAIWANNVGITITGSPLFENNHAYSYGGALDAESGTITISGSPIFKSNRADSRGQAIIAKNITISSNFTLENNYNTSTTLESGSSVSEIYFTNSLTLGSDITVLTTNHYLNTFYIPGFRSISVTPRENGLQGIYSVYKENIMDYESAAAAEEWDKSRICSSADGIGFGVMRPFFVSNLPSDCTLAYEQFEPGTFHVVKGTKYDGPLVECAYEVITIAPGETFYVTVASYTSFTLQCLSELENVKAEIPYENSGLDFLAPGVHRIAFTALTEGTCNVVLEYTYNGNVGDNEFTINVAYPEDELYVSCFGKAYVGAIGAVDVHFPDHYSDGVIKITSSDYEIIDVLTSDYISQSNGQWLDISSYLNPKAIGSAELTITLYDNSTDGNILDTKKVTIEVIENPEWLSTVYVEVPVGGAIEGTIYQNNAEETALISCNSSVVTAGIPDGYCPTGNYSAYCTAVGEGKTEVIVILHDYDNDVDIEVFFIVKVVGAAEITQLSSTEITIGPDDGVNVTLERITEDGNNIYVFLESDNDNVVEIVGETSTSGGTTGVTDHYFVLAEGMQGETYSLAEYLDIVGIGTANITVTAGTLDATPQVLTLKVNVVEPLIETSTNEVSIETTDQIDVDVTAIYGDSTYVILESLNEDVITVDAPTGEDMGHGAVHFAINNNESKDISEYLNIVGTGTATINVKSYQGSSVYVKTLTITVAAGKLPTPVISSSWTANSDGYLTISSWNVETSITDLTYSIQLYKDGVAYGAAKQTNQNYFDFVSYMGEVGTYTYTVSVISNNTDIYLNSDASNFSSAAYTRQVNFVKSEGITYFDCTYDSTVESFILIQGQRSQVVAYLEDDYEFSMWSTDESCLTIEDSSSYIAYVTLTTGSTSSNDITLNATAKYTGFIVSFAVNYENYGIVSAESVKASPGASIVIDGSSIMIGYDSTVTATPADSTTKFNFTFDGWTGIGEAETVTRDMMIVANFTKSIRNYVVNFAVHADSEGYGSVSRTYISAPYGSEIEYDDNTITIGGESVTAIAAAELGYIYSFVGWVGAIEVVNENETTIYAKFSRLINKFTVTFATNNASYGSIVGGNSISVDYNTPISVSGSVITISGTSFTATPELNNDQYEYSFVRWVGYSETVTSNMTITAMFSRTIRVYNVTISNINTEYGSITSGNQTGENITLAVEYGSKIYKTDNILTIGGVHVYAIANEGNAQYSYAFGNWETSSTTITGNATISATFTQDVKTYTVKLKAENGNLSDGTTSGSTLEISAKYGATIKVNGNVLTIVDDQTTTVITLTPNSGYSFARWIGVVGTVEGSITITASCNAR